MAYEDSLDLINDVIFRKKVRYAFIVAAVDILNDPNSAADRKAWANRVMASQTTEAEVTMGATHAAANAVIAAAGNRANDTDVQFVVNGAVGAVVKVGG